MKKKKKFTKNQLGSFCILGPGDVEKDLYRFNNSIDVNTNSSQTSSGESSGECVTMGESKLSKINIHERLNELDIKALDESRYLDLRNMYEAIAPRMSAQTKTELKNLLSTTDDYDAVNSFLQTKMAKHENLEEDDELNEASYGFYNYKYSVNYATKTNPNVLFGGCKDFESAQEMARRCAKQIFENPFESNKNKFDMLDSIYISDDDEEDEDCMSFETEDYIDNLMSEINSRGMKESLDEDLFILDIPKEEDFACSVIAAYQNATKWLDTIKEMIYHDYSCVFFSDYIHKLAHSMPEKFDKFGDILHTANIKIKYPDTRELDEVPNSPEEAFDVILDIFNAIKGSLNNFIKYVDDNNHGMACATEELLMDIDKEYTPLFRMKKALENCNGDYASFDKWIHQYLENKDQLTESLNESEDDSSDFIVDRFFNDIENDLISDIDLDKIIPFEDDILDKLNPHVISKGFPAKTYGSAEDCYPGEGPEFDVEYSDFEEIMMDMFTDGLCSYYKCEDRSRVKEEVIDNAYELEELCDISIYDDDSLYDYLCDNILNDDDYGW